MSIHDGHRQRLKKRFCEEGLDKFEEVHVLELMLFYCIPRKDTSPIAHGLLDRFGTLAQVLDAPKEELEKVEGITENAAVFLKLSTAVSRYYMIQRSHTGDILTTVDQCGEYMVPYFHGRRNETVFLLCLDAKCKVLCCREVGEGSVNAVGVSVRKIVELALLSNASTVVLAHNHPSGLAIPSAEDVQTTRRVAAALDAVDIQLADHIVVADNEFVSLAQSGYYRVGESYTLI